MSGKGALSVVPVRSSRLMSSRCRHCGQLGIIVGVSADVECVYYQNQAGVITGENVLKLFNYAKEQKVNPPSYDKLERSLGRAVPAVHRQCQLNSR